MTFILNIFIVALHALVAWILVEVFVNNAHRLGRKQYVFFHYLSVVAAFAISFFIYFNFFATFSVFTTTWIAMFFVSLLEFVVFGYLYSGDRWFLNYVDWIFPMFLAMSSIYFVGRVIG
ncbi:hypothetical protein HY771_02100 [Candidatus Uhrbacteria bacterium]|nr:hypothetical protein [Candidatus Uhrbacteria bacterium]